MANDGNQFRDAIANLIRSWDDDLEVLTERHVGLRFWNTPRKLDVLVHSKETGKIMAIEAKLQRTAGSAFEKLPYALDDCLSSPIPTIIVFAGKEIRMDIRSKLITSGIGIEVGYKLDNTGHICEVVDPLNLLRQRVYICLNKDWFPFAPHGVLKEESYGDAYFEAERKAEREAKSSSHSLFYNTKSETNSMEMAAETPQKYE